MSQFYQGWRGGPSYRGATLQCIAIAGPLEPKLAAPAGAAPRATSLERRALPAGRRAAQLVRGPVMPVQLESDDLGGVVPGDGLQAHRGAVGTPGHRSQKRIEVRGGRAVDLHDAPPRIQAVTGCRRPVREVCDVHPDRGDAPL